MKYVCDIIDKDTKEHLNYIENYDDTINCIVVVKDTDTGTKKEYVDCKNKELKGISGVGYSKVYKAFLVSSMFEELEQIRLNLEYLDTKEYRGDSRFNTASLDFRAPYYKDTVGGVSILTDTENYCIEFLIYQYLCGGFNTKNSPLYIDKDNGYLCFLTKGFYKYFIQTYRWLLEYKIKDTKKFFGVLSKLQLMNWKIM
jgi:hypothetical protein